MTTELNGTRASLRLSQAGSCAPSACWAPATASVWAEHVAAAAGRDGPGCACVQEGAAAIGFCLAEIDHRVPELLPTGFPLVHQFQWFSGQDQPEAIC